MSSIDVDVEERYQNQLKWNRNLPPAIDKFVHHLVEAQALKNPETEAVSSWDGRLTYAELDNLSSRLANRLVKEGIESEIIVPLCFEKSLWSIVGLLAVLKAGGAFLMLDPSQPTARLETILKQTKANFMLSSRVCKEKCQGFVEKVLVVDSESFLELTSVDYSSKIELHNAAYYIFSSGSTGIPKGIIIEHSQLSTTSIYVGERLGYHKKPRVFQFASYAFDACITDIFGTLVHGGTICIPSDWERNNDIIGAMRKMRVTSAKFTPSLANNLLFDDLPSFECLVLGGEPAPASLIARWSEKLKLILVYGPSECCVICFISDTSDHEVQPGEIGRPVSSRAWIVSQKDPQVLAESSEIGELVIEGAIVGRGYLDDQIKTDKQFITSPPWAPYASKQRFYRTGDLAIFLQDGRVCYKGRIDNQVKIRGQRLELEEVEKKIGDALMTIGLNGPNQIDVEAVIPAGLTGKQLVAFLYLPGLESMGHLDWNSSDLETSILKTTVTEQERFSSVVTKIEATIQLVLPVYAVPSIWIPVKEFPFSVSRKIDRKRLCSFVVQFSPKELAIFTKPTVSNLSNSVSREMTTQESKLQALWANVFGMKVADIELGDNFFSLGGDSVLAIKLIAAARAIGLGLSLDIIFDHPVLCDMAQSTKHLLVRDADSADIPPYSLLHESWDLNPVLQEASKECSVDKEAIQDCYGTTPMQEGLLALSMKDAGTYILQFVYQMSSSVDLERLKLAWQNVANRTHVLRTRFFDFNTEMLQVVINEPIRWEVVDGDLAEFLISEKKKKMGVGLPMSRQAVLRQPASKNYFLVWTIHHALIDGWSENDVINSVEQEYLNLPVPINTPKFNSFVRYVQKQDIKSAEHFWNQELKGANDPLFPPLPSPSYVPKIQRSNRILHHLSSHDEAEIEHKIKVSTFKRGSATTATLIQAAWILLLGIYSDASDIVTGMTLNGRTAEIAGIDQLPGPTVTTIPFRMKIQSDQKISTFLQAVQKKYLSILPYAQFGLQNIRSLSEDAVAACKFRSLLVVQSANRSQDSRKLLLGRSYSFPVMDFAIVMECEIHKDSIDFRATFDHQVVSEEQARRMCQQMEDLLSRISSCSDETDIKELQTISPSDKAQICQWNTLASSGDTRPGAWIVDPEDSNKLTPIGGVGRLLVEGVASTHEFFGSKSVIEPVIIESPTWVDWPVLNNQRHFFKTSDLASYDSDGSVKFIGHLEDQRNFSAERIDVREIENHLKSFISPSPSPSLAVEVLLLGNKTEKLAAFIALDPPKDLDLTEPTIITCASALKDFRKMLIGIDEHLKSRLPRHKLPSLYIPINRIPLTLSKRPDRRYLQQMASRLPLADLIDLQGQKQSSRGPDPPSNPTEKLIHSIWMMLLNVDQFGVNDNFFEIGGGSVSAMRLVSMLRRNNMTMTVSDIFKHPTVKDLALAVRESERTVEVLPFALLPHDDIDSFRSQTAVQCRVAVEEIEDAYPITAMQLHYLTGYPEAKKDPSVTPWDWQSQAVYSIPSTMDLNKFKKAWAAAINRHSSLRTRLVNTPHGVFQVVLKSSASPDWIHARDLAAYLEKDRRSHMTFGDALLRLAIVEAEGSKERFFVHSIQHATYDGFSRSMLYKELEASYYHGVQQRAVPQMNQFIKYVKDADKAAANEFWTSYLAGAKTKPLLGSPPKVSEIILNEKKISMEIPKLSDGQVTIPTLLEVAGGLAVAKLLGCADVIFYSDRSGRNLPVEGIEDLIGPTTTFLPVRIHVDGDQGVQELLKDAQQFQSTMMPYEYLGFLELREMPHLKSVLRHSLNMNINPNSLAATGKGWSLAFVSEYASCDDPFGINIDLHEHKMDWTIFYDDRFISGATVESLLKEMEKVFLKLVEVYPQPDILVKQL